MTDQSNVPSEIINDVEEIDLQIQIAKDENESIIHAEKNKITREYLEEFPYKRMTDEEANKLVETAIAKFKETIDREDLKNPKEVLDNMQLTLLSPRDRLFDALAEGMAYEATDRLTQVMRRRDMVEKIINQLSATVNIVTTIASVYKIIHDQKFVEPSKDFVEWNEDRLRILATHLISHAESISRKREEAEMLELSASKAREEADRKLDSLTEKTKTDSSVAEEKLLAAQASIKMLNNLLGNYNDLNIYVVAKIDPLTKKPQKFYYEDDKGVIHSCGGLKPDNLIYDLNKANRLKFDTLRALRAKVSRVNQMSINGSVIVMQLSLNSVVDDSDEE